MFDWDSLLKQKSIRCERCGGNVLRDYYGLVCLQCGAEADESGRYLEPVRLKGKVKFDKAHLVRR